MNGKKSFATSQKGAVLIVGLIMMLLLTIIGLAAIRGTDLQERMAGNMRDRNLAFQAAEASLRIGEEVLDGAAIPSFAGNVKGYWPDLNKQATYSSLSAGIWPLMDGSTTERRLRPITWTDAQWEQNSIRIAADILEKVKEQPRYTIEELLVSARALNQGGGVDVESQEKMEDSQFYRITARGLGGTADAEVILQSTFAR